MTVLKSTAPLVRETAVHVRRRPVILELHPGFLVVRLKGLRSVRYPISYDAIHDLGARIAARNAPPPAKRRASKKGV